MAGDGRGGVPSEGGNIVAASPGDSANKIASKSADFNELVDALQWEVVRKERRLQTLKQVKQEI